MSLEDCRARLPMPELWSRLGLPHVEKVRKASAGREAKIHSPFREDKSPSFSVFLIDGRWHAKDHATGESWDEVSLISQVMGLNVKDAIRRYHELAGVGDDRKGGERKKEKGKRNLGFGVKGAVKAVDDEPEPVREKPQKGRIVKVYDYHAPDGSVAHQTLRFEPKDFRQRRPAKEGEEGKDAEGWIWTLRDAELFPYRLLDLLERRDEWVFLCEGEKDADALAGLGLLGTTLPMGAGKWRAEFEPWFRGRKVAILEDFDPAGKDGKRPGEQGARKVASALLESAEIVGIVKLTDLWPGAEEGHDVSDWLAWCGRTFVGADEVVSKFYEQAELARVPEDLAYQECLIDESENIGVFQDRLVRRMVKAGQYMFCGGSFWRWKRRDGLWIKLESPLELEAKARAAMRAAGAEKKITHGKIKSIVGLAESERFCFPDDMNALPPGKIAVRNGILDVETGTLTRHRPDYLTTVQCPHDYIPGSTCERWIQWLTERQPDAATRDQIQEMFGYCLVTDINYHSFFFLYGEGGDGKSTCVKVLEHLVGIRNIKSMELEDLDNPFTRAGLVGKSVYLCKELTSTSFKHIGLIKAIVSGDRISADIKYGRGFDFVPKGRLVMESNVVAATPDSSVGFARRFIQISWDQKIQVYRYGVEEELMKEINGILLWALEGYKRLKGRGHFAHTERSAEATRQVMMHRAQVQSYLASDMVRDARAEDPETTLYCTVREFYHGYLDWCERFDVVPFYKDQTPFMREVMARRPAWRDRKVRRWDDGERKYVMEGIALT